MVGERKLRGLDGVRARHHEGDIEQRKHWDKYMAAYADCLRATSTPDCPWYVVPADQKKYRNWAVLQILVATLQDMDPQFPEPSEDLDGIVIE